MRKEAADPIDELVSRVDQAAGWVAHHRRAALIAAGLWAGLVVVLRRQEFASNG